MDKYFNGLRYSSTQDYLIDGGVNDRGDKFRMCRGSFQIFHFLRLNLNKLVTREQLLSKLPIIYTELDNARSDHCLNECIEQIGHAVDNDRLKATPRVGY